MKYLIAIFAVLLIGTIAEGIYVFYPFNKGGAGQQISMSPTLAPTAFQGTPTPSPGRLAVKQSNQAVNQSSIQYLKEGRIGLLVSSVATNVYKGKIVAINTKGGTFSGYQYSAPFPYAMSFGIQGDKILPGDKQLEEETFYLSQTELDRKILSVTDAKGDKLTMSDLHDGDTVTVNEVIDLVALTNYRQSLQIIKE